MAKRGGARPGAGRKPRAEKYATPIADGERRISDRLPWLIEKQFELADGVLVQEMTKEGAFVYKTPPDRQAIEYLINRVMGKPIEKKDVNVRTDNWVFDPTETDTPEADDATS